MTLLPRPRFSHASHLPPRAGHPRYAFTLVELLVVVAIIALLMAILLPSLQGARSSARSTVCRSNLRSIAMWGFLYAQHWDNTLPTNGDDSKPYSKNYSWYEYSITSWQDKATDDGLFKRNPNKSPAVFKTGMDCPEATILRPWRSASIWYHSYGLNRYLGGSRVMNLSAGTTAPTPKLSILDANAFWFADARGACWPNVGYDFSNTVELDLNGSLDSSGIPYMPPPGYPTGPWTWGVPSMPTATGITLLPGHPGRTTNFVFGDGHAEGVTLRAWYRLNNVQRKRFEAYPQ